MKNLSELFDSVIAIDSEALYKTLPARHGVVLFADENHTPIQMITAADMRSRVRSKLTQQDAADDAELKNSRRANLREIARLVLYRQTTSSFETDLEYLRLARAVFPKRYKKIIKTKPAWFVEIDLSEKHPHFRRLRKLSKFATSYGPFASAGDCEKFIDSLADAFNLCRNLNCLRKYPDSPGCPYAEMNRCVNVCAGAISMQRYREILADACKFAAGDRAFLVESLREQMQIAAGELNFELAQACKTRLDRLKFFNSESLRFVRPTSEFRYLIAQPGGGKRKLKLFAIDRGAVACLGEFDWPDSSKGEGIFTAAQTFFAKQNSPADLDQAQLSIGLVAEYLFAGQAKKGFIWHWNAALTAQQIYDDIYASREVLRLSMVEPKKPEK